MTHKVMLVSVNTMDFCHDCKKLEIQEYEYWVGFDRMVMERRCKNLDVCQNAINQYEQYAIARMGEDK